MARTKHAMRSPQTVVVTPPASVTFASGDGDAFEVETSVALRSLLVKVSMDDNDMIEHFTMCASSAAVAKAHTCK